jgi:H+-transporting ATPase
MKRNGYFQKIAFFAQASPQAVLLAGALASKAENADAIDAAVLGGLEDPIVLSNYEQLEFVPFNPVDKRTQAMVRDAKGHTFQVTKGAPQVIVSLCGLAPQGSEQVKKLVDALATKGYRTLDVARADEKQAWCFLGILPLSDPPRKDAAEAIAQAKAHGIKVKMVTGDNVAIGREVASQLGMGTTVQAAGELFQDGVTEVARDEAIARVEQADGFAEVFPERKYAIVKALQQRGHLVAMTGDGVNMVFVVLALLDDIPIMTIAYDHTYLSPTPVRWDMHWVLSIAIALARK